MRHFCVKCHREQNENYEPFCACGGMVDVEYPLDKVQLRESSNPYERFAELLPIERLTDSLPKVDYTPALHARSLGAKIGLMSLYLKNETTLSTHTTKDRMAAVSLPYLYERGVRAFCTSSTGNSSTAYAYAIRNYPEMELYLFTAESFITRVQHADHRQVPHFGLRDASFVEAFEFAGQYAREHHLVAERGFFNPGRREGLKVAFLEASEQIEAPIDWYVQAVSSAMGVYGCYKGAKELRGLGRITRLPKLLCVQQEECAPMVRAFEEGCENIEPRHIVERPHGIAEAILRGNPSRAYPYVRQIVVEGAGGFVAVSEAEIREARHMVEELEGVSPCFSAAAAVAGVVKQARRGAIGKNEAVMVNLTGGDRANQPAPGSVIWMQRSKDSWVEEN